MIYAVWQLEHDQGTRNDLRNAGVAYPRHSSPHIRDAVRVLLLQRNCSRNQPIMSLLERGFQLEMSTSAMARSS